MQIFAWNGLAEIRDLQKTDIYSVYLLYFLYVGISVKCHVKLM